MFYIYIWIYWISVTLSVLAFYSCCGYVCISTIWYLSSGTQTMVFFFLVEHIVWIAVSPLFILEIYTYNLIVNSLEQWKKMKLKSNVYNLVALNRAWSDSMKEKEIYTYILFFKKKKWIEATATYNWRFSWVFGDNGTKVASIRQQKSNKEHFAYQRFQIDSCFCKHIVAMSHKWNVKQKPKVYLVDHIWQTERESKVHSERKKERARK